MTFEDRRVANAANTLYLPARAIVDLGARYRTKVSRTPLVIRAQLRNVGDVFGWRVGSRGGFTLLQEGAPTFRSRWTFSLNRGAASRLCRRLVAPRDFDLVRHLPPNVEIIGAAR